MAYFKSTLVRLCVASLLLHSYLTFAAPVEAVEATKVVKRAAGTEADPHQATFDISGWQDIAEEDCYIALCVLDPPRKIFPRNQNSAEAGPHRTESGQDSYPFQDANRERFGIMRISDETISAEEFPWASTANEDRFGNHVDFGRHVVSATNAQQDRQRNALSAGLRRVPWGEWFQINFEGAPLREYCRALFQDPPDTTICRRKKTFKQTLFGASVALGAGYVVHKVKEGNKNNFVVSKRTVDGVAFEVSEPAVEIKAREASEIEAAPAAAQLEGRSNDAEVEEIAYNA